MRLVVVLIVCGLVAWLITFLPLPAPFPQLIWVVLILVILWELLSLAGYVSPIGYRGPPPP